MKEFFTMYFYFVTLYFLQYKDFHFEENIKMAKHLIYSFVHFQE